MTKPKKIILISIDTLRADHLGCYGYMRNTSPAMDALAREGILFKNVFSPSSFTIPAHTSIFTGKYPSHHSIGFNQCTGKLNKDIDITLAEILKTNGYNTAAFISGCVLRKETNLDSGFGHYDDEMTFQEMNRPVELRRDGSDTMDRAIKWICNNKDNDFFVFLHLFDVHGPFICKEPYNSIFSDDAYNEQSKILNSIVPDNNPVGGIPAYQVLNKALDKKGNIVSFENRVSYYISQYDGNIRYCDSIIQKLVSTLQDLSIYDDVMLIITSDHGEAFGENDVYFFHGLTVTLDQIFVPLIIKPHKSFNFENNVIERPISTIDIMPTILSVCNYDYSNLDLEGYSLIQYIDNSNNNLLKERIILSEIERQYARLYSNGLMEVWKKPMTENTYFASNPELLNLLNGMRYFWNSGKELFEVSKFDKNSLYEQIFEIINTLHDESSEYSVLEINAVINNELKTGVLNDISCNYERLTPFELLKSTGTSNDISAIVNKDYDFIVSVDFFEHVNSDNAENFIELLFRRAKKGIIIASPFETSDHQFVNNLLNLYEKNSNKPIKASDYYANIIPLNQLEEQIKRNGYEYSKIPFGYLPYWLDCFSLSHSADTRSDTVNDIKLLFDVYYKDSKKYYNKSPSYRQIIIISKKHTKYGLNTFFKDKTSELTDKKENLFECFLQTIKDNLMLYLKFHNDILENSIADREWLITNLQNNKADLEASLTNLKNHTANLENIVKDREERIKHLSRQIEAYKEG